MCYFTRITLIFSLLSLNYLFDIWNKVSKNFIGRMFWLQLVKLLIMLLLCDDHNINTLIQELGSTKTYNRLSTDERSIVNTHSFDITAKFAVSIKVKQDKLPTLYWLPKLHKRPYKARFIANSSSCTTAILCKLHALLLSKNIALDTMTICLRKGRN